MTDAEQKALAMITDCQRILAEHIEPDGPEAKETISKLLSILDGPRWRELKQALEA